MRYSVPAIRAVQNGQELFLFFLPAKALKALPVQVEKFDSSKPYDDPNQGYQRAPENNRARRFARYLAAPDAKSPTAIMLNDRNTQTTYDPKKAELIFETESGPIFNYDGQHRQLGYEFRLDGDEQFAEFPIPVVMTRGMDKLTEMMQFRTINSTAKGVATGLVNAILANLHATKGDDAIKASEHRNVVCYKVTEALNKDPNSPWHMLIALPNESQWTKSAIAEDPAREHTRVIRANSFVDALRPVYDYMAMLKMAASLDARAQEIASTVTEFWSALKQKMPEAFERPNDYALFKSNGVGPMHLVLRHLMIEMHAGRRKYVKDEFLTMMEGSDLLGNPEFWHSDNDDGARNYSGKAGWPDLAKRIIRDLEEGRNGPPSPEPIIPRTVLPPQAAQRSQALSNSFVWHGSHAGHLRTRATTIKLIEVQIGDNYREQIRNWAEVPFVIANWIIVQKGLTLPMIQNLVHQTNSGFLDAAHPTRLANGQYLNVHGDSREMVRRGRRLLDRCGLHDVHFRVLLEDGRVLNG
jgi:DGQHR domain-containing protein